MKKLISVVLCLILCLSCAAAIPAGAEETDLGAPTAMNIGSALYVHAVSGSADTEAWQEWQSLHDANNTPYTPTKKYFFLPSSASDDSADIYNGFPSAVTVNGVSIPSGETRAVSYSKGASYSLRAGNANYTITFMKSTAEAAIYVNSTQDFDGADLMEYLNADKSNSASATGAIVNAKGKIDNTAIKKIKGRGNTTWDKDKKPYNITYSSKVSIAGMAKNKKYSLLANFQDDSLSRNRILYDLSDAVGMPYASDSRYVDFYANGYYWGSYQMCEKVEAGSLVTDVDDEAYLEDDGVTVKADFPFIAEIDASAGADDYYVTTSFGVKVTIKAPEIDPGNPGYDEVKAYVKQKFENLLSKSRVATNDLTEYADIDSLTKLYLINELGKNWDSGVSSCFLTYKQDEDGNYKFFGSPVWDYDNSLGNAVGVGSDLNRFDVTDYTQYSGWWCRYKDRTPGQSRTSNLISNLAVHNQIMAAAPRIWFEEFMPAIRHFSGETNNAAADLDLYSAEKYYSLINGSAEMNYTSGWLLNTGSWIADHSSLKKAVFNQKTGAYTVSGSSISYQNTFEGMFNYARDWMTSRAAWLSSQFYPDYECGLIDFDVNLNGRTDIFDATEMQRFLAEYSALTPLQFEIADIDGNGVVDIDDVTCLQMILAEYTFAEIFGEDPDPTEPTEPTEPTDPTEPKDTVTVTFTDALGWGDNICIYYYSQSQGITSSDWPGEHMAKTGDLFTYEVPNWAEYIIFNNGVGTGANNLQTQNIPFDGQPHHYYATSETNDKGRHAFVIE